MAAPAVPANGSICVVDINDSPERAGLRSSGSSTRADSSSMEVVSVSSHGQSSISKVFSDPSFQYPDTPLGRRVQEMETVMRQQEEQMRSMSNILSCVQRDRQKTVSVLQYNILAAYLGRNTQPWFLYGADVSPAERRSIFAKYYERDDRGAPKNSWPAYVEGILTPAQIEEVKWRDENAFKWSKRREKLVEELRDHDADVISLVELDHPDYFEDALSDDWDMVFHKRPRAVSLDGCGVFWRRSKFDFVAQSGFDFIDGEDQKGRTKKDRSCLMVLLTWRCSRKSPLVVISTHLAKDPDDRSQTALRVRQVTQLMEGLLEFTSLHGAADAPVVLCGDLNAKHFGEIRGIARTVFQITGSQLHKFLWCASDVPTGPTSITESRQCRIDSIQFLTTKMEMLDVRPVPKLPAGQVIPNELHPSDHFPIYARFKMKDSYQQHREVARAWLECVAGREKVHPLTQPELREAFDFFDRDTDNCIHRHNLEEACYDVGSSMNVNIQQVLLDCFPNGEITYDNFIRAYEVRLDSQRVRSITDLQFAFEYFAGGETSVSLQKLEEAFREIAPISFSDAEVKQMIERLNLPAGQEMVDVRAFCEVVCRSNFPKKDRRRQSMTCGQDNMNMGGSKSSNVSRSVTKELGKRLDKAASRLDEFSEQERLVQDSSNRSLVQDSSNRSLRPELGNTNNFELGSMAPPGQVPEPQTQLE